MVNRSLRTALAVAVVVLLLVPVAGASPADQRLRHEFPLAARILDRDSREGTLLRPAPSTMRMESGSSIVELRSPTQRAQFTSDGGREVALVRERTSHLVEYEVTTMQGIREVVSLGRSVLFVPLQPRPGQELTLSAPILVDARGWPSTSARWVVDKTADGSTRIRLRVEDGGLQFPLVAIYASGPESNAERLVRATTSALRPSRVASQATPNTISGRLTNAVTGAAITDEFVGIFNQAGELVSVALSNFNGDYESQGDAVPGPDGTEVLEYLPPGTYYVLAAAFGYIPELYNDLVCYSNCDVTSGTPVVVVDGVATTGINFALSNQFPTISGRVTNSVTGAGLEEVVVSITDNSGTGIGGVITDANGDYEVFVTSSGPFYARTVSSFDGFVDELYSNIDCTGCDPLSGTPITLTNNLAANIDFSLNPNGGRISGRLTDAHTQAGLPDQHVTIYDSAGSAVTYGFTDPSGAYLSFHGLATGTYYAVASASDYVDQTYDQQNCPGGTCVPTSGDPIAVTLGSTTANINFPMNGAVARVSGRVTDSVTGNPLPGVGIGFYSSTGSLLVTAFADEVDGGYEVILPLAGTYYARTHNRVYTGYNDELYSNFLCSNCDVLSGTPIEVEIGVDVTGVDFSLLASTARIGGTVTASNVPLEFAFIEIYDSAGLPITHGTTAADGTYLSFDALAEGQYFVIARREGYDSELYQELPCGAACDPVDGTAIGVLEGQIVGNINFTLTPAQDCPDITVSPTSIPDGVVGQAYSQTFTAGGGAAPYTFSSPDELPPGLTLDGDGSLSGSPLQAGGFTFFVVAVDTNGCDGARSYTVVVTSGETSTLLTVSPTTVDYGASVTLSAVVTPLGATGTITFKDGGTALGTEDVVDGSASLVVSLPAGTHPITATYNGDASHGASTSNTVDVTVNKLDPVVTWNSPGEITYPTALSSTQLDATANVAGTFAYDPASGTVLDAGTHTLSVVFTPDDPNYNSASRSVLLVVNKAEQTINWANPADIVYGTALGAAQLDATVSVPGPSPAGALTYNPAAGTVLPAGPHTLNVSAAATSNYNAASKSVSINVLKATPVFTNLSAPTIVIGTASTTLGGTLSAGSLIPSGSVVITLNGVPQSAAIQADGSFSSAFDTSATGSGSHTISFAYAGDANFNGASATSTLVVAYATTGGVHSNGRNRGTAVFRVQILNANGGNLSSPSIDVVAYGVRPVSSPTWLPADSRTGDPIFRFVADSAYQFNLATSQLPAGDYVFGYTVEGDPTIHLAPFTIR